MTVRDFATGNSLEIASLPDPDREITGAYTGDLLSWVMGRAKEGDAWVTIMSNLNVIAVATLTDVSCVILAEGVKLDGEVLKVVKEKGVNLLYSSLPSYETCILVQGAL